jgi:hypothetical protein
MFTLLDDITADRDDEKLMRTPLQQLSWSSYCNDMIPIIKRYIIMMLKEMNRILHYHQSSFDDDGGSSVSGYDIKRMNNSIDSKDTIDISRVISQLQDDDDTAVPNDIPPIIEV